MAGHADRARIWNSLFALAWSEASWIIERANGDRVSRAFDPPAGLLSEEDRHIVAAVLWCHAAMEARANHLVEELFEAGAISEDVARAARSLAPGDKWFLIPTLAGSQAWLNAASPPHRVIALLCDLRDDIVRLDDTALRERLPSAATMIGYVEEFVAALEDLNVILRRNRTASLPALAGLARRPGKISG
jgi:hypothetical protein